MLLLPTPLHREQVMAATPEGSVTPGASATTGPWMEIPASSFFILYGREWAQGYPEPFKPSMEEHP